ncbi:MAG TPA: chorismate mutase, partial [Bacteroidales bacterium]|nr:chorismate mutase [Bacteroidales bacterium]HPT12480.1 chorismate mutase [Bacteroidales bacterium]
MENSLLVTPLEKWDVYKKRPLMIAGPCSAETEKQVMETARQLAESGRVDVFRAGIWKPRTRPNSFEGVGSEGLAWLKQVKQEYGLPVAVEVATEKHVYEALKFGIDILWIGARTTVNPFAMQEIADALRGVDVMVFIKNPINPELDLWIGALERIHKAGIKRLGAIHRGFSSFEKTAYRNLPKWQIPIDLRQRIPDIPLICDPSHMGGSKSYILDLAQKSMDLNFDGLMIESHIEPETALSDKKQQVKPHELIEILDQIILRKPDTEDASFRNTLEELRNQIDIYDEQLFDILESRMLVADTIGLYKKEHNITILQSSRWKEIVSKAVSMGKKRGLGSEFVSKILEAIHQESISHQMKIMNEK